ncbi:MFS general substrate transporter [Karstenula rhodostoma CBS 690.94]|uniref:MFS general substrate transporter n=1 Tax=Karstenula rhodostoma CBS 690.94 TaxID=1392251 RepID=A0A9P4U9H3_9PLEO|nr:MFS general substrate transporter [Karstenula rhodostoma CBS 690.94]
MSSDSRKSSDTKAGNPTATPPQQYEKVELENAEAIPQVDVAMERRLLRKLDLRIIPMLCWVYLMNFMDRVNIGNARLYGLEEDLGLAGSQYQIAVGILFVTYYSVELDHQETPARYLGGLLFAWGMVATFSSFVENFAGLIACRLLLGAFEAGLFPGVILYLSMFYNKKSLSLRNAWFYGTSAIAGAVGGLVAYAIGELDGARGWSGWRWIIMINGVPTVLTAVVVLFVLPNSPETAKFLTEEDRANLVRSREAEVGQTKNAQFLRREDVIAGAKDWKTYAFAIGQFTGLTMLYSFSVFLPTIIDGIGGGWSRQVVQALTVPVYVSGAGVYLFCAWYSDRIQQRGIFIIGGYLVSMVGYILLIINQGVGVSFAGCFVVAFGLWTSTGLAFSWIALNNPRYGKRAFASGMQITIGNASGVSAPFLFSSAYAPTYFPGYGATIGLLCLGLCIYTSLYFWFRNANKRKLTGEEDWRIEGLSEQEAKELGEHNPGYLYTI